MTNYTPSVSIIVPVKGSQNTILGCVQSLLTQDYKGTFEIILVGDVNDPTWEPIRHLFDGKRLRKIEVGTHDFNRDANPKRNIGLKAARGEILALTDSDMFLPVDWIRSGVTLIQNGHACVAGGMISAHQNIWGRYVDTNVFGAKTPRLPQAYVVNKTNFGTRGHKPPVTANVFLTRTVYDVIGGLDPNFEYTYDDYEWFQRIANGGFNILCTPELMGGHAHRQGFRALGREYINSGRGCSDFMKRFADSPFTRKRQTQLLAIAGLTILTIVIAWLTQPIFIIALALMVLLAAGLYEAKRLNSLEAIVYPAVTGVLLVHFYFGVLRGLTTGNVPPKQLPEVICADAGGNEWL